MCTLFWHLATLVYLHKLLGLKYVLPTQPLFTSEINHSSSIMIFSWSSKAPVITTPSPLCLLPFQSSPRPQRHPSFFLFNFPHRSPSPFLTTFTFCCSSFHLDLNVIPYPIFINFLHLTTFAYSLVQNGLSFLQHLSLSSSYYLCLPKIVLPHNSSCFCIYVLIVHPGFHRLNTFA